MKPIARLREGEIYRDLDGSPVQLVRIIGQICCWVPIEKEWGDCNERQYTLIEHFRVRFSHLAAAAWRDAWVMSAL